MEIIFVGRYVNLTADADSYNNRGKHIIFDINLTSPNNAINNNKRYELKVIIKYLHNKRCCAACLFDIYTLIVFMAGVSESWKQVCFYY